MNVKVIPKNCIIFKRTFAKSLDFIEKETMKTTFEFSIRKKENKKRIIEDFIFQIFGCSPA